MTIPTVVLAIGGFDGSGGAGNLADVRAIQLSGGYPCAIVTALTAQNTLRVDRIERVSTELIRRQFRCLVDDFQIGAIKIGLLPSVACVETLIECLESEKLNCPIVLDPVMRATSGDALADVEAIEVLLQGLVPLTTLITPNIAEASKLTNRSIDHLADAIASGNQLLRMGCQNVLVKGGHFERDKGTDIWCYQEGYEVFEPRERQEGTVRGTGCMFASAIACHLGQGKSVRDAITVSKALVSHVISEGQSFGQGTPVTTLGIKDQSF
ncbi:MAG: bifunctional hydroxymethylpyrimidine kinase/phosphomethylpyrimidine kinase [Gammaproteobacteria bacterium]|nr:bifunctional hydroxymethylpyrimidine kinase/phosphomethylpyrimidine kinase [Gammaproteobacteria bacterium]